MKTREQGGSKVDYIDGHFAMTRANEVFGHDGWSYSTRSIDEVRAFRTVPDVAVVPWDRDYVPGEVTT